LALYLQLPNLQILIIGNFKKAWHYTFVLSSDTSATEVDESKNKKLYIAKLKNLILIRRRRIQKNLKKKVKYIQYIILKFKIFIFNYVELFYSKIPM